MFYSNKYKKYKEKYINLKNSEKILIIENMNGGKITKNKIFDLSIDYKFSNDLQNNLKKIYKLFGNRFNIKYNDIEVPIIFTKEILPSNIEFYQMSYYENKRNTYLIPFRIDFIDMKTLELNNNSYIPSIQKTNFINGAKLVKLCIEINRILGVKKMTLTDGTSVTCGNKKMDLSFIKLLENNMTYYMNLGFQIETSDNQLGYYRFLDNNKLIKTITNIIDDIKKIKIKDIIKEYNQILDIIRLVIIENNKYKIQIIEDLSSITVNDEVYIENSEQEIPNLFNECYIILGILNKYTDFEYIYLLMIKLFKNNCEDYCSLFTYIVENSRSKIIYGKKIVIRTYTNKFFNLLTLKRKNQYSYNFY